MNFLIGTIVFIGSVILRGLVLKILWGWFIVPLGVISIGISHALGISIIITFITFKKPAEDTKWEEVIMGSIGVSGFALLLGYIFQLFM